MYVAIQIRDNKKGVEEAYINPHLIFYLISIFRLFSQ